MTGTAFEDGDMERRVQVLEASFARIDGKLDKIIETLAAFSQKTEVWLERIETSLEAKASAVDLAELRGMVRSLPTIWQLITLVFGILAGGFAIVRFGLPHP